MARKSTGSSVDAKIFNQGFSPFERGLKQYWYKFRGTTSGGINIVRKLCEGLQPDLRRPILVDQRATGLLGNYIVSLRGMGGWFRTTPSWSLRKRQNGYLWTSSFQLLEAGFPLGLNVSFWPNCRRLFHPKLFIGHFKSEVVWSDGSMNLTPAGWHRNREIAILHRPGGKRSRASFERC